MRILVTGCAGFIGYHMCDRLLNDGHDLLGVDDLSTGQQINIDDLTARPGFQYIAHDISAPLPSAISGARFDLICNLACPASPVDFGPRRLHILAACSRGLWNLLDLARDHGARLLHTSTSEVYGDPLEHPQRETYWGNVNPIGARSCYDEGKRFGEALIVAHRGQYGTKARIARIFNTYGPRMRADDGRALPTFISQALRHQPITVHGDGRQTRSFCYVTDEVDGLLRLALSDVNDPVNIGNPVEVSMLEVAREVVELCGSRSQILHTQRLPDDPRVRCPDISRARSLLGWEPRVDRREGLRRTIDWFRTHPAL